MKRLKMDSKKTAIAARMYIALRREAKRTIDVEWLLKNTEYAFEIITLAKQHTQELVELAEHLESLLFGQPNRITDRDENPAASVLPPMQGQNNRYIGRLR